MWKAAMCLYDLMDFIEYVTLRAEWHPVHLKYLKSYISDLMMSVFCQPSFTISDVMNQEDTYLYLPEGLHNWLSHLGGSYLPFEIPTIVLLLQ